MALIDLKLGLRSREYFLELECLRGIAVLLVFLFHARGMSTGNPAQETNILFSFISAGNSGVTLFFVLSGFLLSLPFIRARRNNTAINVRSYFISRILRILPLYIACVLLASIITGNYQSGLKALVFGYVGFDIFPYSVVWWTLSTEVQFYLALPIIYWLFKLRWTKYIFFLSLLAWTGAYFLVIDGWLALNNQYPNFAYKSFFARLPAFMFGMGCAYLYDLKRFNDSKNARHKASHCFADLAIAILLIILGGILQHVTEMGESNAEKAWHIRITYDAIIWALIFYLLVSYESNIKKILSNSLLSVLGKISYSFYLVHVPILFVFIAPSKGQLGSTNHLNSD